jgi:hypothetical protein
MYQRVGGASPPAGLIPDSDIDCPPPPFFLGGKSGGGGGGADDKPRGVSRTATLTGGVSRTATLTRGVSRTATLTAGDHLLVAQLMQAAGDGGASG